MSDDRERAADADQGVFLFDVSDEFLEASAGLMTEKAAAFTLAFCSGLSDCNSDRISAR